MITGASSGISVHLSGSGQFRGTKEDGLIFDSLLSGIIKGKGPAPCTQEEAPDTSEMMTSEQNTDQETTEQAYMSLFLYRGLQDDESSLAGKKVPTEEKANQTKEWAVTVADQQLAITEILDDCARANEMTGQPEKLEAGPGSEQFPFTNANINNASGSQASEQTTSPENIGIREYVENERNPFKGDLRRQQDELYLAETEDILKQSSETSLESDGQDKSDDLSKDTGTTVRVQKPQQTAGAFPLTESRPSNESSTNFPEFTEIVDMDTESKQLGKPAELQVVGSNNGQSLLDEEENIDHTETAAKVSDSGEHKIHANQTPMSLAFPKEDVSGNKLSKVTVSHIENIQKTIELQLEKTQVPGNTVVKILLTPDNIGDIHVRLIKTKERITAVLHVQDIETKGLLEDQLPLLMEPFKHSASERPLAITVVADANLAFSFSEGTDPGNRKMQRQESRKKIAKEKTEIKEKPMTKQSAGGLSLLA